MRLKTLRSAFQVALALTALLGAAFAAHKPEMHWADSDFPPASIVVDGLPTNGYVDRLRGLIIAEMPEFEHQFTAYPFTRAWAMLADGQQICYSGASITPERERIAYMTPTHLIPPLQLIVRKDSVSALPRNEKGEVLPASLFDSARLRGLIAPRRSYSAVLDTLLKQRGARSGVSEVIQTNAGSNILQMLAADHADYTIESSMVFAYQISLHPELNFGDQLVSLPIAGTQPIVVGIACPHTNWGRQIITRIDSIVARISQRDDYQQAEDYWLTPDAQARYREAFKAFYQFRAKPSDPAKFAAWPQSPGR